MDKKKLLGLSRPGLLDMSTTDAKKVGQKYASFITGLRGEIINAGLKENQVRDLMKGMAALGDCNSGVMCVILT